MQRTGHTEQEIERLASALGDPTRRRVFFYVRQSTEPMTKDDVAAAVGIDRRLAGFHLDKLVEQGFLAADYRRREGGSGPGAGRPPKIYRLADPEAAVTLPERHYDWLAELLLRAMEEPGPEAPQVRLERVGFDFGRRLAEEQLAENRPGHRTTPTQAIAEVVRLLSRFGFAARTDGHDAIRACSCPFEEMAFHDPERICGLDRSIWRGILSVYSPSATLSDTTARAAGDDACVAHVVEAGATT